MKLQRPLVTTLAWSLFTACAAHAAEPVRKTPDASSIKPASSALSRSLDVVLEEMLDQHANKDSKSWFRKLDSLLDRVERFEQSVTSEMPRADLYRAFDEIDGELAKVLKGLEELKPDDRPWQRMLARVRAENEELLFAIAEGDTDAKRVGQVVDRQAELLASASRQLHSTAQYVLADVPATAVLLLQLKKLRTTADALNKLILPMPNLNVMDTQVRTVTNEWAKVILSFQMLKPRDSVHLLRSAGRVDRIHQRLFHLLEMKGECPVLVIRS